MSLSCHIRVSEWIYTLQLPEYQEICCSKHIRDMIRTYSQMHRTDKYSQHRSVIWPVWVNGWVFVCELSGCGFWSRRNHLNFRYSACFEKGAPWHSDNYRVWIHSETQSTKNNWRSRRKTNRCYYDSKKSLKIEVSLINNDNNLSLKEKERKET